ncbi:oligoendopeptidase F [Bacillus cereus]|uniref:oligoendopeptidase F n=1 Tax=Bacillus cereus TaxID=1396 RepID=UPI003079529F
MKKQLTRNEVPSNEKWDLTHIYPDMQSWETDYGKLTAMISELKTFNDNINSSKELLTFLKLDEEASFIYNRLAIYSGLKLDEDTRISDSQSLGNKVRSIGVSLHSATSFFTPFLLSWDKEKLEQYLKEEEELHYFKKDLYEIYKYKEHTLSKEKEELLSELGEVFSVPQTTFGMINNADMKFGTVKDEEGNEVELTRGLVSTLLESPNREVRKEVFHAYHGAYVKQKNAIASTLGASIKNNVLLSKLKHYPSALESSLFDDEVPLSVYENLIQSTRNNLSSLHRYMKIRKEVLKLDELRSYDLGVPLAEDKNFKLSYDEAYELMLKGLAPLGEEYISILKAAKQEGWIDVRETEGKRSGAYSWGPYSDHNGNLVHPYVLLNYQDDLDNVFTLAHEMGHALHKVYSNKHQPRNQAQYTIFVAEVASTVNEVLLMKYLMSNTDDINVKKYLLNHFIDQFRGTLFTQVMFAEFEKITHEMVQQGEALTADSLSNVFEKLYTDYNSDLIVLDEEVKYGWSRIPHFYNAFYVYQYATGFSAANAIVKSILEEGEPAVKRYLEFLKTGGSDYPIELLKITGVDLSTPQPVDDALSLFKELVDEFEELML